jgi:hypothetical protein
MDQSSYEDEAPTQKLRRQRRALAREAAKAKRRGSVAGAAFSGVAGAALALVGLGLGTPAGASTFTVTNLNDAGPGSLRQAVLGANSNAGADLITFQAGLTGTITLTSGQLQVYASADLEGPGADVITVSGNDASRVFYLYADSAGEAVTIAGLTIAHGRADEGAGIYDQGEGLTLDHVVLTANAAVKGDGGGLGLGGIVPAVTVRDSTITGNSADGNGGGVSAGAGDSILFQRTLVTDNQAAKGGGAYFYDPASVGFEDSTIAGNNATTAGGGIYLYDTQKGGGLTVSGTTISGNTSRGSGGGVFVHRSGGPLTMVDSTVSGNTGSEGNGGGIFLYHLYDGSSIQSSTIANNTVGVSGGGIFSQEDQEISLVDTIVAGNHTTLFARTVKGAKGFGPSDLNGGIFDSRYSLIGEVGAATVNDLGGTMLHQNDPQLGPLANHGGLTQTQVPTHTSPAVNHGDPAFTPPPATDQRGFPRVADGRLDIGAVELTPGVDVDPVTVPTLGGLGKLLLGVLLAGGGLLLLRRRRGSALSGAALAVAGLGLGAPADAATFTVTNLNDAGPGSLRQAVLGANSAAGADLITFQAGLTGTITLTTGQLQVEDAVDIQGPGAAALTVSGNDASRVFYLYADAAPFDVTLSGLTISHGTADGSGGGGIKDNGENLTLDHVVLTANSSPVGPALWMDGKSLTATVRDSAITGNTGNFDGGVHVGSTGGEVTFQRVVISGNTALHAGGAFFGAPESLTIEDSTVSGNHSAFEAGGLEIHNTGKGGFTLSGTTISGNSGTAGGGLVIDQAGGPVKVIDSTISGNDSSTGGGIYLYSLYNTVIQNSTIAGNTAGEGGGGGIFLRNGEVSLVNTIVADNLGPPSSRSVIGKGTPAPLVGNDLGGEVFDSSYSLIENQGTATVNDLGGTIFNQDPQLGPLANHGGPTQTQRPALTSPAVDHGDPAFAPPPATDQRGFPRVADGRLDIGAVEITPGVDFDVAAVPTLGGLGKLLLAGLLAGGALLLLRRA